MKNRKSLFKCIKDDTKIDVPEVWDRIEKGVQGSDISVKTKRKSLLRYKKPGIMVASFILVAVILFTPFLPKVPEKDLYLYGGCDMNLKSSQSLFDRIKGSLHLEGYSKKPVNNSENKYGIDNGSNNKQGLNEKNNYSYEFGNEAENKFIPVSEDSLSTFSIDVDTASYGIIKQFINNGITVPKEAVCIEEMINYFKYDYPKPTGEHPFSLYTEIAKCPWNTKNNLLLIGLQGKEVELKDIPNSNLVFLIDVSGSMSFENKLPLVKKAFNLLIENLRENDRISIVTYAGSESVVLQGEYGSNKKKISEAVERLESGGSTAGAKGIETAYSIAKQYFIEGGNNRVILATDGDFNVGVSSESELKSLIESKRNDNIYLSVLGFGFGNLKDNKMETLSQYGNGNYSYINSEIEAKKVFVDEMGGTLLTIAKDVKLQIDFNKDKVKEYRLIGYENRILNSEDFTDDTKDAGEMGAGHRVTAIYELVTEDASNSSMRDWCKIDIRYKNPNEDNSKLMSIPVSDSSFLSNMSDNFTFVSSVAEFGLVLKDSAYKGNASLKNSYERIKDLASIKNDQYKMEFLDILRKLAD